MSARGWGTDLCQAGAKRGCGSGTWGARCPSLADYDTATDAYARGVLVLLPLEPGGLGRAQSEPVRLGPDEGEGGGKVLTLDGQLQAGEVTLRFASRIVGEHRRFLRKRREHGQDEERHPLVDRKWARAVTGIGAALVVTILCVAACADSAAICSRAGGEYANGACTLSGPSQLAMRHWCETHGGVHLAGPNICGYGSGGP